jgi:hypothetical protein
VVNLPTNSAEDPKVLKLIKHTLRELGDP